MPRRFDDWKLSPEEIERRLAHDKLMDEFKDYPYSMECEICCAMRRMCAHHVWLFLHPDWKPEREAPERCETCGDRGKVWDRDFKKAGPCPDCNSPAPPYPGMKPGGLAETAYNLVKQRGPRAKETPEELARAKAYWAGVRGESGAKMPSEAGKGDPPSFSTGSYGPNVTGPTEPREPTEAQLDNREAFRREGVASARFWEFFPELKRKDQDAVALLWDKRLSSTPQMTPLQRAESAELLLGEAFNSAHLRDNRSSRK